MNNKYDKTETDTLLNNKYDKSETDTLLNNKYDKSETDTLLNKKLNINNPQDMAGNTSHRSFSRNFKNHIKRSQQ